MRLTTNYPDYTKRFYAARPELAAATYDEQYRALASDCFGWADFWTHALRPLGYEVWESIANNEQLQRRWARENDFSPGKDVPLLAISIEQVRRFRPEIVFVDDQDYFDRDYFAQLREVCPSLRLVIGWCGSPFNRTEVFGAYDIVLSNMPHFVQQFREMGLKSEFMWHGFGSQVLERLATSGSKNGDSASTLFSFIGSVVKGNGFHNQREALLKTLTEETDLQVFAEAHRATASEKAGAMLVSAVSKSVRLGHKVPGVATLIDQFPRTRRIARSRPDANGHALDSRLAARMHPPLYGLAMYRQMMESAVTLNNHIDVAGDCASNMRLFEATGVGACLLTDWKSNLPEMFEPDAEVVVYRTPAEAVEKYRWLIEHERERRRIAAAGQARTLKDHTLAERATRLHDIIRGHI